MPLATDADLAVEALTLRSVFQPIVDLAGGAAVGAEVLTRGPVGTPWEAPDVLFSTAAKRGLTGALDRRCIETAIDAAAGYDGPLFVNVEPGSLAHPATTALLERFGPKLVVEVTERRLTGDPAGMLRALDWVRAFGARVALDDVGAKMASTAFLEFIRPEVVKIDMSLVQGTPSALTGRVATAVLAYAERTGAVILAEGIETERHLQRAHALGARLGQGYLFARPAPEPPAIDADAVAAAGLAVRVWHPRSDALTPFDVLRHRALPCRVGDTALLLEISRHLELQSAGQTDLVLLGAFQDAERFTDATAKLYARLAVSLAFVGVLGVGLGSTPVAGVRGATIAADDALAGEWTVIGLGPHYAGALVARDLGDRGKRTDRRFEFCLTHDREVVVDAALALMHRITHTAS